MGYEKKIKTHAQEKLISSMMKKRKKEEEKYIAMFSKKSSKGERSYNKEYIFPYHPLSTHLHILIRLYEEFSSWIRFLTLQYYAIQVCLISSSLT
jgi:hypothetical protein